MIKSMTGLDDVNSKRVQKIYGRVKKCEPQISGCKYPDAEKLIF